MNRLRSTACVVATAVAAVFAAGLAFAQQPQNTVAKLSDVQGNVLVSQGDAMVAGSANQRLPVGTRVVTTAGAGVTIAYDAGCDIKLNENQRFTVSVGPCAALLSQVESLGPAAGAIGGGTGGATAGATAGAATAGSVTAFSTTGIVLGTAAAVGLGFAAYEAFKKNPVSPN